MQTTVKFKEELKNRNVVQIAGFEDLIFGKTQSYKLQQYFQKKLKRYKGFWSKDVKDVLAKFNTYLNEQGLEPMEFKGLMNEYYIPFGELELQVKLTTPFTGKYESDNINSIIAEYFIINDKTTTKDVDLLIEFLKEI